MIVWLNGTHGVGKTTTRGLVQELIPGSRLFDADAEAFRTWLRHDAEVVDTTHLTPEQAARRVVQAVAG